MKHLVTNRAYYHRRKRRQAQAARRLIVDEYGCTRGIDRCVLAEHLGISIPELMGLMIFEERMGIGL